MVALGTALPGMFTQAQDSITALPSGTNLTSPQLVYGPNRITVSANNTDGVVLPPAKAKAQVLIFNDDAAQDVLVFGAQYTNDVGETVTDTINGTAGGTGVTVGEQTVARAFCVTDGAWHMSVSVVTTGEVWPTS